MKIYYEKRISPKTNRPYDCIVCDLGWRKALLSFDRQTICDMLNCTNSDLYNLPVGYTIALGELHVEKEK
jgi:hypothetical protein